MKKFIVAFIGFHDNALTQELIYAETGIDAMCQVLLGRVWDLSYENFVTEEDVKTYAYDCDSMISAFELD